jgi:3-carboxy-cis,cis-muconate cycloisomerase
MSDGGLLSPGWAGTGVEELLGDRAWVQAMLDVEVALARAQARLGIIPGESADVIERAASADRLDLNALVSEVRATGNPVVGLVAQLTAAVRELDPEAADHVHRGSTSQDILDTAVMLLSRRVLQRIDDDLVRCADALADLALAHRSTVMAGRTLTQHAVPITFGLKAATWLHGVLDGLDRLRRLKDHGLPASLGGAAGTMAAYAEYAQLAGANADPTALATEFAAVLGLAGPSAPWHGVRTPIADLAAVLCTVSGALGKLAADVLVLSRTEIGELTEPTAPGRGASSAMPQKQNPVFATMIATAARQIPPTALILFQSMVVEDERSAGGWQAEWQPLRESLRLTAGAARNAAELTAGLQVNAERMAGNLGLTGGAVVSERLSARLTPLLGKAEAKRTLTEAIAGAGPQPLDQALAAALKHAGHDLPQQTLHELLDPAHYLGAAPELVDRAVRRWRPE